MKFQRLESRQDVCSLVARLNASERFVALDTETTGLDPHTDRLVSIVLGTEKEAWSFDPEYKDVLLSLKILLVLQNFKFDFHMLKRSGVDLSEKPFRDTMLLDHLRDENAESHGLDAMVQRYFQDNYKEVFWNKYDSIEEAPSNERLEYECKDVIYTARIYTALMAELAAEGIPDRLVDHVHRLAISLWHTEYDGVAVDLDYVTEVGTRLKTQIEEMKPKMRSLVESHCETLELNAWVLEIDKRKTPAGKARVAKPEFSFDSSTQLKKMLYERLRLPVQTDPKTKKPTTGDDALAELETRHPLIPVLRAYRGHQKVYGSYIEGTLDRQRSGRIYPEFNVNGTKTGRISHSNPNMGQLPSTGGIRGIYVPDAGCSILSADYKQLEVVLAAHFSQDRNLLRVVFENASLHDITAEGLGIPRSQAKTINFALQYGAGVGKIQTILNCSKEAAKEALDKYWETYSGLKRLIDECHAKVDSCQPIVNPFGRKRRFPSEFPEWWMKAKAQRQAFNALIQGTGGDLTSRAFYLVSERMRKNGWGRTLFSVHDELLTSPKSQNVEETRQLMITTMVDVGKEINLTVPLSVDCSGPQSRWED